MSEQLKHQEEPKPPRVGTEITVNPKSTTREKTPDKGKLEDFQQEIRTIREGAEQNEQQLFKASNSEISVEEEREAEVLRENLISMVLNLSQKIENFKNKSESILPQPKGTKPFHSLETSRKIKQLEGDLKEIMDLLRPEMAAELPANKAKLAEINNPKISLTSLLKLINDKDPAISAPAIEIAVKMAQDPKTTKRELQVLANETDNEKILLAICNNESTDIITLDKVYQKNHSAFLPYSIIYALIENPNIAPSTFHDILDKMIGDDHGEKDNMLAQSLEALARRKETSVGVLIELLDNEDAHQIALKRLLTIAEDPKTSPADLELIAGNCPSHLQMSVARNTNTDASTLAKLLADFHDKEIAIIARRQLKLRVDELVHNDSVLVEIGKNDCTLLSELIRDNSKIFNDTVIRSLMKIKTLPGYVFLDMFNNLDLPAEALVACAKMKVFNLYIDKIHAKMLKIATNPQSSASSLSALANCKGEGTTGKEIVRQANHTLKTLEGKIKPPKGKLFQ